MSENSGYLRLQYELFRLEYNLMEYSHWVIILYCSHIHHSFIHITYNSLANYRLSANKFVFVRNRYYTTVSDA